MREFDKPPIASQVAGDDLKEKLESVKTKQASLVTSGSSAEETSKKTLANGEEEEEEYLSPEDASVRKEWKGNCTAVDWNRCNKIRQINVQNVINNQFQTKHLELNCLKEPILCLKNGWTANR